MVKNNGYEINGNVLTISSFENISELEDVSNIKTVIVCEGVTVIPNSAFEDWGKLKKVSLPNTLKEIGSFAFSECSSLKSIVIPEGVENIKYRAFNECKSLKEVILPKTLIIIEDQVFLECPSLDNVEIPEGVERIGVEVFAYCKSLTNISLPNTLKVIGEDTFNNCTSLEELIIPDSVVEIENFAFSECINLKRVVLPKTFYSLGACAFSSCYSLEEIVIPTGIICIDTNTFLDCHKLKKITLPSTLKFIYDSAFSGCIELKKIVIPEGVEKIDEQAFKDCSAIESVILPSTLKEISGSAFKGCAALRKIVIPEGVEKIGHESFKDCSAIESVTLPSTLRKIGDSAFAACHSLKSIILPNGLEKIGRCAFSSCKSLNHIIIPEGVKFIGVRAFLGCTSIKEITLPGSIEKIESKAFEMCNSLEKVTFCEGIESTAFGMFVNCTSLKRVILPRSLKVICDRTFMNCPELEEMRFTKNIKFVSNIAFTNTPNLRLILETNDEDVVVEGNLTFLTNRYDCLYVYDCDSKQYKFYYKGDYHEFNKKELFKQKIPNEGSPLLSDSNYINLCYWVEKNKFLPHESIILNMPIEDIDMFYINNNYRKWAEIVKMANMGQDTNKVSLFKLCYVLGIFQESTSKRDEAVKFIKETILDKLSEDEIHASFDGFDLSNGFDEMYAEFFMKYYKNNNDFMYDEENDIDLLAASYNNFKIVRKFYPNKVVNTNREADLLLPEHVMSVVGNTKYEFVDSDNELLASLIGKYGYTQKQFDSLQEWFNEGKNISERDMKIFISPDIVEDNKQVSYKLLEKKDPFSAVLGNITNCCQVIGGMGESCVKYGMIKPNSKFMIFSIGDRIIGQSWVWYDEESKVVCLDNIEVPKKISYKIEHDKELQKSFIECLKRVANNFISEMETYGLEVVSVTVGKGYNDIGNILKREFKFSIDCKKLSKYSGYSDADEQYVIYNKKG